jgi:hypothetical protein
MIIIKETLYFLFQSFDRGFKTYFRLFVGFDERVNFFDEGFAIIWIWVCGFIGK